MISLYGRQFILWKFLPRANIKIYLGLLVLFKVKRFAKKYIWITLIFIRNIACSKSLHSIYVTKTSRLSKLSIAKPLSYSKRYRLLNWCSSLTYLNVDFIFPVYSLLNSTSIPFMCICKGNRDCGLAPVTLWR